MTRAPHPPRSVIFDFDGTLADTFPLVYSILVEHCAAKRRTPPPKEDVEHLRNMDSRNIFNFLGIPRWQVPIAIAMVRRKLRKLEDRLLPCHGVPEALAQLHDRAWRIFVLSSNTRGTIRRFFTRQQLPNPERLEGGVHFFGKDVRLRRLLLRAGLDASRTLLVGDETRDVHAGHACGTPVIGVTWGFNTAPLLREAGAVAVVDSPAALVEAMERLLPGLADANGDLPQAPSHGSLS